MAGWHVIPPLTPTPHTHAQVSLATFGSGTSSAVDPPTVLRAAKQMIAAALDGEEPSAKALKLTKSEARVLKAHLGDVIAEIRGLAADDKKRKVRSDGGWTCLPCYC